MGIHRDASYAEIKRAFRQRSVELHPDKNPSLTATEEFNKLRLAFDVRDVWSGVDNMEKCTDVVCVTRWSYQVLGDAHRRPLYDLFGESAIDKDVLSMQIEALVGSLTFYAIWAVLTYVLTLSEAAREARAWSLAAGILFFMLELNFIYGGARLPPFFFPMMTINDFVTMMHSAFPLLLNGCRAIGEYFHHDLARENFALSVELLKSNQVRYAMD